MLSRPSNRNSGDGTWRAQGVTVAVAVLTLLAIAVSMTVASGLHRLIGAGLALIAMIIVIADARYFIIPNELTAAAVMLGLVNAAVEAPDDITSAIGWAITRGAVLALAFLGVRVLYRRLRQRDGLGLGDVKLAGVAGVWLDWLMIPIAVEIAALGALSFYALRFLGGRPVRATTKLPFGLFLAPAIWFCWLLQWF